jgi:Na+/H+ antiporter NhaD/arsenite permease-like protein
MVSNTGGLLTPLGDPPLFLGFLKGVDFFWTLSLWPQWLAVNMSILAIFYIWDSRSYQRESKRAIRLDETLLEPIRLRGWGVNIPLLFCILLSVILQSPKTGKAFGGLLGIDATLHFPVGEIAMLILAGLSLACTPRGLRKSNDFNWGPIVEVAVLFIGIFITMVPALALLEQHGSRLGIEKPWQFFWLTGLLSSFLDNAPTYVTFGTLASSGHDMAWLASTKPDILAAISCGAVFMGANTYIGNGPNFMVKAIAEHSGYKMPSFLSYMAYSFGVLVPLFVVVTLMFF